MGFDKNKIFKSGEAKEKSGQSIYLKEPVARSYNSRKKSGVGSYNKSSESFPSIPSSQMSTLDLAHCTLHRIRGYGIVIMRDPIKYKGKYYDREAKLEYVKKYGKDIYGKSVSIDTILAIPTDLRIKKLCDKVWKD